VHPKRRHAAALHGRAQVAVGQKGRHVSPPMEATETSPIRRGSVLVVNLEMVPSSETYCSDSDINFKLRLVGQDVSSWSAVACTALASPEDGTRSEDLL
jgi:hypothetical protein